MPLPRDTLPPPPVDGPLSSFYLWRARS